MLTLNWGIDMLFQKLIPEKGNEFEKHPLQNAAGGGDFM